MNRQKEMTAHNTSVGADERQSLNVSVNSIAFHIAVFKDIVLSSSVFILIKRHIVKINGSFAFGFSPKRNFRMIS